MGNGNGEISSEKHFENSKTRRGSYFLQEPLIFVQIFELYLVSRDPVPFIVFRSDSPLKSYVLTCQILLSSISSLVVVVLLQLFTIWLRVKMFCLILTF